MLAARIKLGTDLFDRRTTPTYNFTQRAGRVKLTITIELDPSTYELIDAAIPSNDPDADLNLRDAVIGDELLTLTENLEEMKLSLINSAEDFSTFTIRAKISSKLPGTGGDTAAFVAKLKKERELEAQSPGN